MRTTAFVKIIGAAVVAAALAAPAAAQPVPYSVPIPTSIGKLVARPMEYDGKHISVTGTVQIRGTAQWLQLCDEANTCIYLDRGESLRASAGQRLTLAGDFAAHATLRYTPLSNVLIVEPRG